MQTRRRKFTHADSVAAAIAAIILVGVVGPATSQLLFDVFVTARENARITSCHSNMRVIGLAFIQYAQDYDDCEPAGAGHWAGDIYPYLTNPGPYKCPDDVVPRPDKPNLSPVSYAMNANAIGYNSARLSSPQSTVLATEYDGAPAVDLTRPETQSRTTNGVHPNTAWGNIRLGSTSTNPTNTRHRDGLMFLACDGHVELLPPGSVSSGSPNRSKHGRQGPVYAAGTANLASVNYKMTFSTK